MKNVNATLKNTTISLSHWEWDKEWNPTLTLLHYVEFISQWVVSTSYKEAHTLETFKSLPEAFKVFKALTQPDEDDWDVEVSMADLNEWQNASVGL